MSHIIRVHTAIAFDPPLDKKTRVNIAHNPLDLMQLGVRMTVEVSPAGLLVERQKSVPTKSITVWGLLDTGATITAIDHSVAEHLGLLPIGMSPSYTAKGVSLMPDYTVNMSFTGTELRQILNIRVGSCNLPFNLNEAQNNPTNQKNTGVLIGRDVMSLWNITWHGPASTVFISD